VLRPVVASFVFAAVFGSVLAAGVGPARAEGPENAISIDNFSFHASNAYREGRHHRDLDQQGRYSARYRLVE
jgi:hypothetical protein